MHVVYAPLPPAELIFRVTGQTDPELFLRSGIETVEDYTAALADVGHGWGDFRAVLDFGSGCGRVLRILRPQLTGRVAASDVDHVALTWLAGTIPGVAVCCQGGLPPLRFDSGAFDLVIAHSVFSHLPEDYQDAWLADLARVTQSGGQVLASVHGPGNWERHTRPGLDRWPLDFDTDAMQRTLIETGHLYFDRDGSERHGHPDYYHAAWHTPEYIRRRWACWFEVVAVREGGARPTQDLVVLRRR